ncbi:hypothetical protein WNY37_13855 [Henriciella sp. AS95]|uniref:GumC family protein n=1 Tax=Henriciella sp. AS95 TaxID=3135782 RepID=UPI00316B5295
MTRKWSFLRGGPKTGRILRYLIVLAIGWFVILALAGALYVFTPRTYESGFTLILPGAGQSTSVNLDSLGQASSNAASPFGDHTLSPTENYKRLFQSYRLRGMVAERMGQTVGDTPAPNIRLANQTNLIFVSVRSASPEKAKALAETWHIVFNEELAALRTEEQALRRDAYQAAITGFEQAVEEARAKIIAFQSEYGLTSTDQFQDLVAQTEVLRLEISSAATEASVAESEIARLSAILEISPDEAADILSLLSDPTFQTMATATAKANALQAELSEMYGENHPEMLNATEQQSGLYSGLKTRGRSLLGYERFHAIEEDYYTSDSERTTLISSLVRASAKLSGARKRHEVLSNQLNAMQTRVASLAGPATELDALMRDHQIAETVFASALAQLDANRTDTFASYPLTQTIEVPGLPESPATPSKKFIALGTFAVMFLFAIGLALLWIRLPIIRALLKTL